MNDNQREGRTLKATLVVRDEKDDPSILDIVRVAIEDGLRAPSQGTAHLGPEQPTPDAQPERYSPVGENLETAARAAVEEALEKVMERFQAEGKEPKFEPAKWVEQLSKVWAVIQKAKARGVALRVKPAEGEVPPVNDE